MRYAQESIQETPGRTEDQHVYPSMGKSAEGFLREALAEYAHDAWARYMDYLLERLPLDPLTGARLIDSLYYNNLRRLIDTPYSELHSSVQEYDRDEARRMMGVINALRNTT
jgi:hypothetical protein